MHSIYYLLVFDHFCNIFSGVICNFVQYLPHLLYLMDSINYCIGNFFLYFTLYLLDYLLTILDLFAFGKFLLLRHVIY